MGAVKQACNRPPNEAPEFPFQFPQNSGATVG
jgi:hypothetical protein